MKFANRMNQFGEGVFSRLAVMRKNRLAQGKEVYDLSIGAPNIPPTKRIMEVMAEAVMKPAHPLTKLQSDALHGQYPAALPAPQTQPDLP